MKHQVFYLSGTGNTEMVVESLKSALDTIELLSIFGKSNVKVDGSIVGFAFPVHSLGLPRIMAEFIESADLEKVDYMYAIATMSAGYGVAFEQATKILKKRGKMLSATFALATGGNSNLFVKIPGTTPMLLEEAYEQRESDIQKRIQKIAMTIRLNETHKEPDIKCSFRIISNLANKAFVKRLPKFASGFHVDSACNQCGICAKHCPVGNIEMTGEVPKWRGKCEACLRCFNICPKQSVQFGKMDDDRMHQRYKKYLDINAFDG
ncbi:MAG: EFR1 family ferrodoxin [Vallitaleaceae bacterium]|jgi:ferredoxin|nr:EFR1 family ferrodoxin [Vallitaleaceae bacterium]